MLSDIEIAQQCKIRDISEIAKEVGISEKYIEKYGNDKAKVSLDAVKDIDREGKLVLVTAITPTAAGEGKTTTSIGLADALHSLGEKAVLALREPSLGPVFGMKGGAAGGGYSQVVPMEDINLHFTGDFHAISAANNLLAAMIDNHIYQGNRLNIDPRSVTWKRAVDMNDRQLRHIVSGIGGKTSGVPHEDGFDITAASEIMAVLCLASSLADLKERLGEIVVGYTYDDKPVTAKQINANGAMTALLVHAIKPNLVQTLEGTPAFVHGGPFANIAHGCNSVVATKTALAFGDYVITEAGFGADLGAEKFFDIKCRSCDLKPSAVVIVATIRALKMHGGLAKNDLKSENPEALANGIPNLLRHADNIKSVYGLAAVVAINRFPDDTQAEIDLLKKICAENGLSVVLSETWAKGGKGGTELAKKVIELCAQPSEFTYCYDTKKSIEDKINAVAKRIYRADNVVISAKAKKEIDRLTQNGFDALPVCIAKTQYSFSDNPKALGAPENFEITIRSVKVSAGARFLVVLTGDVMTMPGLPRVPAAENIDVDEKGEIRGLF